MRKKYIEPLFSIYTYDSSYFCGYFVIINIVNGNAQKVKVEGLVYWITNSSMCNIIIVIIFFLYLCVQIYKL